MLLAYVVWLVHSMGKNFSWLDGDDCRQKNVYFGSCMVMRFSSSNTMATGDLWRSNVIICISGSALLCIVMEIWTITWPFSVFHVDYRAGLFYPVRAFVFFGSVTVFHGMSRIFRIGRVSILVKFHIFERRTFISRIMRD